MSALDKANNDIRDLKKRLDEVLLKNEEWKSHSDKLKESMEETLRKNASLKKHADELADKNQDLAYTQKRLSEQCDQLNDALEEERKAQLRNHEKIDEAYDHGRQKAKLELLEKWDGFTNRGKEIPLRKPDIFRHGGNFKRWLKNFNHFANASKIPESKKLDVLFTYLDQTCQSKVETLKLDRIQKSDFDNCCEKITRAIEGTNSKSEWRTKLFAAKQEASESITDFVTRLNDMADRCYGAEESTIKSQILLDCFLSGLASEQICFEILKSDPDDYTKAYGQALDLEAIHALRKMKPKQDVKQVKFNDDEMEIFAVQNYNRQSDQRANPNHQNAYQNNQGVNMQNDSISRSNQPNNRNDFNQRNNPQRNTRRDKYCSICHYNNHSNEECFFRQVPICMFCGRKGHVIKDCYTRLNQMARNSPKASQSRGNIREVQRKFQNNGRRQTRNIDLIIWARRSGTK